MKHLGKFESFGFGKNPDTNTAHDIFNRVNNSDFDLTQIELKGDKFYFDKVISSKNTLSVDGRILNCDKDIIKDIYDLLDELYEKHIENMKNYKIKWYNTKDD